MREKATERTPVPMTRVLRPIYSARHRDKPGALECYHVIVDGTTAGWIRERSDGTWWCQVNADGCQSHAETERQRAAEWVAQAFGDRDQS